MSSRCALIVIGNEILSGKVTDENSPWLLRELYGLGQTTSRVVVIPDGQDLIAEAVAEASASVDHVFTSGGVGPTLDDLTFEGVAQAFGLELQVHPRLEAVIREHLGERANANHLRMAKIPESAELLWPEGLVWPVVRVRNVVVLPGEPGYFREKFGAIRERFRTEPFFVHRIFVDMEEGALAPLLDQLHSAHPGAAIGSYPVFDQPDYRVLVTLECKDEALVAQALSFLLNLLPAGAIVRHS